MNPYTVIANALQSIPPHIRRWILLGYSVTVVLVGILALVGVDLDYDTINAVLLALGGYLGFQSAANVPPETDYQPRHAGPAVEE
jgi:uncharacterized membrane protein